MRLIWLATARADRRAICDYIELDNPVAALEVDAYLGDRAMLLLANPELGRPGRRRATRELVLAHYRYSYVLVYRVRGSDIQILRLLHGARRRAD